MGVSPRRLAGMSAEEIQKLVFELDVHQIELKLQNQELREAQIRLAESRDRFNALYDFAPVGYLTLDKSGAILEVNLTLATMLRVERKRLLGAKFTRFVARAVQDIFYLHQREVWSSENKQTCELLLRASDSSGFVARMESICVGDPASGARHFWSAISDITDRKRAEEALARSHAELESRVAERTRELSESQERYRQLVQALPTAVYTCDSNGRIVLYNAAAVNLWGREPRTRDRWCGSHRLFTSEAKRLPLKRSPMALAVSEGKPIRNTELIIERPDGSRSHVLVFPDPTCDSSGHATGAVNVLVDITSLKETEATLRTTERKLRTLAHAMEQSPASILITNPAGEIEYVNPAFTEVTGYSLPELLGKNPRILKSGHQPRKFYREMWKTITDGKDWRGEFCNRKKNGEVFWEYAVIAPVHDEQGELTHFVSIKEDITERRRAGEELHDREEKLRAILNTVVDAVISIDQRGTIVGVNPAAERMFGYAEREMLGQNVSMLMPSPYREEHPRYLANYHRTGEAKIIGIGREVQAMRKDGTVFPIDLAISEVNHLHIFTGVIRDITERKRLEAEVLRISEEERQRVAADLHDGVCQELASIGFAATAVQREIQRVSQPLARKMERIASAISEATGHARAVARGMAPVVAGGDSLMQALQQLVAEVARSHRIRCLFECPMPVLIEDPIVSNQLYRIAQEAIHNAARHGKPKRIRVQLSKKGEEIWLRIKDNGVGLPADLPLTGGLGLRTMKYRAELIRAHFVIQSRKRGGTEVVCRLLNPLARNET